MSGTRSPWGPRVQEDGNAPPPIFTGFQLRKMQLVNRVVVSPMCQYSAVDGTVHDWHLVHLGSRAIGGAGLVITEMTNVSAEGRITPGCAGMYAEEHVAAWERIVEFVHGNSRGEDRYPAGPRRAQGLGAAIPGIGPDVPLTTTVRGSSSLHRRCRSSRTGRFRDRWSGADMDRGAKRLRRRERGYGTEGGLRSGRAPHGSRLPAVELPLAAE